MVKNYGSFGNNKKILITGASGLLGYHLCKLLKDRFDVYGTYCSHPIAIKGCTPIQLDITNKSGVSDFINQINPAIIIHAAAVSAPDLCENNPSMARAVNAEGTQNIVDAAKENKRRIVYVSTDMVFDGKKGSYSETDMPEPVNFYGKSKLEGENICLKSAAETIVVRITLQYGWGTKVSSSFSDWLIKKLKSGEKAPLFTDQYRSPTLVIDTAIGLELAAVKGDPNTVYHLAASDRIDRYAFGVALASVFNFPEDLLKQSLMRDMPGSAPRPRDVSLNGEKFIKHFNFQPRSVNEGLKAMFCQQHETE